MTGIWYKEYAQGRRFIIKISPGQRVGEQLVKFAEETGLKNAVIISAVGSLKNVRFRGIKTGAKRPITPPRMQVHEVEGPLELCGLEGNLFPDEKGSVDSHLHVMVSKSSGEVIGGHLFDAEVFATCEIILTEVLVEGIERHASKTGGVSTIYIDEE
ncbi:PPC domain-containing DNA-binding protein [Trichloromonas sp.]|uniref:PPC domain-containing DNA-binding protein n=1 Tax=Trichloromonas sp. TaxID=3069249 RepID=UPI003D8164F1